MSRSDWNLIKYEYSEMNACDNTQGIFQYLCSQERFRRTTIGTARVLGVATLNARCVEGFQNAHSYEEQFVELRNVSGSVLQFFGFMGAQDNLAYRANSPNFPSSTQLSYE